MLFLLSATLFLSASLLFLCEPMVGKAILPILGGSASVWSTCVAFFQIMLLAGYGYAHLLGKLAKLRDQIVIHMGVLIVSLAFLPIRFNATSDATLHPIVWLLWHLTLSVGLPFAAISASAPLLQSWLARTPLAAGRDPYFLYATSNAGSILALLAFPLIVEPEYGITEQASLWLAIFIVLIVLFAIAGSLLWQRAKTSRPAVMDRRYKVERDAAPQPSRMTRLQWLAAAFVPSALMLAVTNHISLNIGSFPFLWIVPLVVYLLTFVIAFARRLRPPTKVVSAAATAVFLILFPITAVGAPVNASVVWLIIAGHVAVLFFGSLLCHSHLADRRPAPQHLTEFYFIVALGGVLGGIFTALFAPLLFTTVFEYPLLVAAIMFFRLVDQPKWRPVLASILDIAVFAAFVGLTYLALFSWGRISVTTFEINLERNNLAVMAAQGAMILILILFRKTALQFSAGFAILLIVSALVLPREFEAANRVYVVRDFFGVKKVLYESDLNMRKLVHGDTLHGLESMDPVLSMEPLSYYHKTGPVGDVMELLQSRSSQRVAVVGLGAGAIGAYAGPERHISFFDIDPQVVDIAQRFFGFIRQCGSACDITIGDGRLALQAQPDRQFDLIVLDAFNSDSIPLHLVSREAVRIYMTKLKPDGLLLFHVSNRYLNVAGLVGSVMAAEGIPAFSRLDADITPPGKSASHYVLVARRPDDMNSIPHNQDWALIDPQTGIKPWTDDYSNLMSIVNW